MLDIITEGGLEEFPCTYIQTICELRRGNKYRLEEDCQSSQICASILQKITTLLKAI